MTHLDLMLKFSTCVSCMQLALPTCFLIVWWGSPSDSWEVSLQSEPQTTQNSWSKS